MKRLLFIVCCFMLFGCKEDPIVYLAGTTNEIEIQIKGEDKTENFIRGSEFYLDKETEEGAIIYQELDGKKVKYEVELDRKSVV